MNEPTLRAVIADDEAPARSVLREMLETIGGIAIVGECADGYQAVKTTGDLLPDLLFLDIQMPRLDGFEVLELIPSEIAVVFVTAYDEYALKAFEVNAVDYLLKPFTADRLKDALARARERRVAPGEKREPDPADLARAARPEGEFLTRVVIKDGAQIQVVGVERVDFLMAQGDYVAVHADGKSHLKQQTMQSLSDSLDPARFVRIHRSYVLNLDRLARIEPYGRDSKIAVLADGTELPVSRSGYTRLRALLD